MNAKIQIVTLVATLLAGCAPQQPIDVAVPQPRESIRQIVAATAEAKLGPQWVSVALRIAKVESGFNPRAVGPRTRHGRALGVMQVLPGSARALGFSPSSLLNPEIGAQAGVAHMRACIDAGVTTDHQMALCHVAGTAGWHTKLRRQSELYKRHYANSVLNAR